jgi:ATP-dependent Clp protease ATP-binding subunit ClpA
MSTPTEFERILHRSYDLAVQYQHEYVSQEHLLAAILENSSAQEVMLRLKVDLDQLQSQVKSFLADNQYHSVVPDHQYQPKYTTTLLTSIKQAKAQSLFLGKNTIDGVDLMVAMFNTDHSWAVYFMQKQGISKDAIIQALSQEPSTDTPMEQSEALMLLGQFAVNLNQRAEQRKIDPLVGRQTDVWQITQTLARKTKNNPLLVGPPGVGKTQIVEGLALLIHNQETPPVLWNKQIWSLDISSVVAGTKFRGDFEERMKNLITALKSLPDVILFIDEIHMIMGAGSGGGQNSMDVANILKPALGRGEIRTIGSTTEEEFRKHFEKDRALLRRFHKQEVLEPSVDEAKLIMEGVAVSMEKFHAVKLSPGVTDLAVDLSVKYIQHKHLPDKAIDLIDAACAAVKISDRDDHTVMLEDVQQQLSRMARVSLDTITQQETDRTKNLRNHVISKLFGQESAVDAVVDTVWMSLSGLRENNKTMGSFLLHGPTGTGKTELAKLMAQALNYEFVRFDMSEFQEKHTVARLLGSPPGYVGYSDGAAGSGALINQLEQTPQCVLLIDEVEKAHPDILNIFLQAMDRGELTSSNQKTVSLRNVILMFTSNLGSAAQSREPLGFVVDSRSGEEQAAINQFFAPEFRNRLDQIVSFHKLNKQAMNLVLDKQLVTLNELCEPKQVQVHVNPDAREWLLLKGFDPLMGARPLSRCIDTHIKKPMAQQILFGQLQQGGTVLVSVEDDQIKLTYLSLVDAPGVHWQQLAQSVECDVT